MRKSDVCCIFVILIGLPTRFAAFESNDVEGQDCTVYEPLGNYKFNLTNLRTDLGFQVKSNDLPETFYFNVCGGFAKGCINKDVTACMKRQSKKEAVFGYKDSKLLWNDGSIRFSFTGEKCDEENNYTMNVLLQCDHQDSTNDRIGAFHESGKCEATILLRTEMACLSTPDDFKDPVCTVKGPNNTLLTLAPLRNYNHHVYATDGTIYTIGVCNPVLYGHQTRCERGSAVCHFDPKPNEDKDRYNSVGIVSHAFEFDNDVITLKMSTKQDCDGRRNYTTKIEFECDESAADGYPSYHGVANCTHMFTWPTALACSEKRPCHIVNPDNGFNIDFSTLAGIQYVATNQNNTEDKVIFSICSNANDPCGKNTGSCIVKRKSNQTIQAGIANSHLMYEEYGSHPYLIYKSGEPCKKRKNGGQYTTRINFICADNSTDEAFLVEDDCDIVIDFKTPVACDYHKNCVAKSEVDGAEIDLRRLIKYDGNYLPRVNERILPGETYPVQYLLNVCRPLNSKYSLNCGGTAGACRTVIGKDGKHTEELSLGRPDYRIDSKKRGSIYIVEMMYFDGGRCISEENPHYNSTATTSIKFYCDHYAGLGEPILDDIFYCMHVFDFPTTILCPDQKVEVDEVSCILMNRKNGVSIDLKLFGTNGVFSVQGKDVNICGGDEKNYTINYKLSELRIESSLGKTDVEIQLKCSYFNTTTTEVDSRVLVMHETPLICPLFKITPTAPVKVVLPDDDPVHHEKSTSLSSGYWVTICISVFGIIILGVAYSRTDYRNELMEFIRRCRARIYGANIPADNVQYERVRLSEEPLLMNANVANLSDSDDDDILL